MQDVLTSLVRQKRKLETKVTNDNKDKFIRQMNKNAVDFGYSKISKNASVKDVARFKSQYMERLTYDIVTLAIQEGKDIIAEIESRDLKKSNDYQTRKLGEYGKRLAKAKKESNRNLTKEQKNFLERGNNNIKGYGNEDIITLFEHAKNKKEIESIINEVKTQDPKQIFFEKQMGLIDTVFQKVGVYRENDLALIKSRLLNMDMPSMLEKSKYLLQSLEMFDSDGQSVSNDETELNNARLDDLMTQFGLKPKSNKKAIKETMNKYKSTYNDKNGLIY